MRTIWRRALLVGAFCVLPWLTANAQANGFFRRDYVAVPTSYYAAVPTAYAIPTVYAYPTVYDDPITYSPTSYVAGLTSFVVPTVYETSYVAAPRRFFGRRAFAPRSYVMPAVYDYAVAEYLPTAYETASSCCVPEPCCATGLTQSATVSMPASGGARASRVQADSTTGEPSGVKPTPSVVESVPSDPEPVTAMPLEPTKRRDSLPPPAAAGHRNAPVNANDPSPPTAPAADQDSVPIIQSPVDATPIGPTPPVPGIEKAKTPSTLKPPAAPSGDDPVVVPLPKAADAGLRKTQKPIYSQRPSVAKTARTAALNVLEGKVVASDSGQTEEGVRITVTNRLGKTADRLADTDAYGRYAVRLPDGEWTVKVTMPSGRTYAVSQLSVSGGQIIDDQGRDVPTLVITR